MSDLREAGVTPSGRRAIALGVAFVALLLILGGGTLLRAEAPASQATHSPQVGRTTMICTTSAPLSAAARARTEVSAVAIREAPDRPGSLSASTLDTKSVKLKLSEPGKGAPPYRTNASIVIAADGAMATASSAVIVDDVTGGNEAGLKAAPCLAPATAHWFSGLGATDEDRTDLILSNPDDAQAQVDLRYYGRSGRIAVPGSPGLVIRGARLSSGVPRRAAGREPGQCCDSGESGPCHRGGETDANEADQAGWSRLAGPIRIAEQGCRHPRRTRG